MDDLSLNRAVAEARGWTEINMGGAGMAWELPNGAIRALPNICTDPAAWGGLLTQLAEEGHSVELMYRSGPHTWEATVWDRRREPSSWCASSPGRALAKAFLASKGIST